MNIHKGFSWLNRRFVLEDLREAIRSSCSDIVFLQEVVGENYIKARKHSNWPAASQYEFLADTIWQDYVYGKNVIYQEGHHGNAILSKFPIITSENIDISTNKLEKRGFLYCKLKLPGKYSFLHCICVHLSLIGKARKKQIMILEDYIRKNVLPDELLVVAGDFNDWSNKITEILDNTFKLQEVFVNANGKPARSFPRSIPILRLDRIYQRGFISLDVAIHHKEIWSKLSDHAALSASLKRINEF